MTSTAPCPDHLFSDPCTESCGDRRNKDRAEMKLINAVEDFLEASSHQELLEAIGRICERRRDESGTVQGDQWHRLGQVYFEASREMAKEEVL